MSNLTAQQELFAQEYVKCGNATYSYKKAYPKSLKWKENSVYINASKMLADTKVSLRVKELQKELADKNLWTKENSIQILRRIAYGDIEDVRPSDRTNAVKELNKMHGYEINKMDHTSSDGSMSPTKTLNIEDFYKDIKDAKSKA